MCEPGTDCTNCPYRYEVETEYDVEVKCAKDEEAEGK